MYRGEEVKEESSLLAALTDSPESSSKRKCVFAVIVEATAPLKTEKYSNYFTVLKVIDPSFNYRCKAPMKELIFQRYIDVYIFSESPVEAPRVRCVGDIVRLRGFKFRLRRKGDVRCYDAKFATWDVFGGQKDDPFEPISSRRSPESCKPLSEIHVGRLSDLRYWSDHFFFSSFLRFVTWWRAPTCPGGNPHVSSDCVEEDCRDLIVRCVSVDFAERVMRFHDSEGVAFRVQVNARPTIAPGAILQMRNVHISWRREVTGWVGHIHLVIYSSCLALPPFCCDYRALNRLPLAGAEGGAAAPRTSLELFQPYTLKDAAGPPLTGFRPGADLSQRSTAQELRRLLLDEPQKHIARKFLVEVEVDRFHSLDPAVIIQRYYPFEKQAESVLLPRSSNRKHRTIYNLLVHVKDAEATQTLPVYIVTNENEFYLFDSWRLLPRSEDNNAWDHFEKQDFQPFVDKLQRLCGARVALLLQLTLTTSHKYFFKLVETVFLPFD